MDLKLPTKKSNDTKITMKCQLGDTWTYQWLHMKGRTCSMSTEFTDNTKITFFCYLLHMPLFVIYYHRKHIKKITDSRQYLIPNEVSSITTKILLKKNIGRWKIKFLSRKTKFKISTQFSSLSYWKNRPRK